MAISSVPFAPFAAPLVEPGGTWAGQLKDEALRKLAPAAGFIADADAWKKLWTAWRPDEELPEVDFARDLILVGTVPGPNLVMMRPTIDEHGDVKYVVGGAKIGGPGFGYKLIQISREGVKRVNGRPLAGGADADEESITVTVVGTLKTDIVGFWRLRNDTFAGKSWFAL
jgi:hypothetical protein